MKTDIFIVRHGQTEWNKKRKVQGWYDSELSTKGKKEAREIGVKMDRLPLQFIYSSPLKRALDTAKEIAKHHNLHVETADELREGNFGVFEGMVYDKVKNHDEFKEGIEKYGHFYYRPPEGESYSDVYNRATNKLDGIAKKHKNETVTIVTHGGVIRNIAVYIGLLTRDRITEMDIPNVQHFHLSYDPKRKSYNPIDFPLNLLPNKFTI